MDKTTISSVTPWLKELQDALRASMAESEGNAAKTDMGVGISLGFYESMKVNPSGFVCFSAAPRNIGRSGLPENFKVRTTSADFLHRFTY